MMDEHFTKEKLISFPKIILDVLEQYKLETGINVSNYIRHALVRQMVIDKLIYFKTKKFEIDENNRRYIKEI